MRKKVLLSITLIFALFCIVIYFFCCSTVTILSIDESNVKEITYLSVNNGYQPLPSHEVQHFIRTINDIETRKIGDTAVADVTGEITNQFCITLTDDTQYIIGGVYPHLVINGKGYRTVGNESEEKVKELEKIFKDQADHMVCW